MLRHPLHPALVHFPIACWSLATIGDVISLFTDASDMVWQVSGVLLAIGTVLAIVTMLTGLLELNKIDEQSKAISIVNLHMTFVTITWCLYATSLFLRYENATLLRPGLLETGLCMSGFIFLGIAAWLGAELVYGHHIGVRAPISQSR